MLLTKEEAKQHICPILSIASNQYEHCLADKCAAWRWTGIMTAPSSEGGERLGFCGLFGHNYHRPDGSSVGSLSR